MSAPNSSVGFTFAAHLMDMEVKEKPSDNAATRSHGHAAVMQQFQKISLRDILTEGQQKTLAKEKVNLVEKGLVKIMYEGGEQGTTQSSS